MVSVHALAATPVKFRACKRNCLCGYTRETVMLCGLVRACPRVSHEGIPWPACPTMLPIQSSVMVTFLHGNPGISKPSGVV